MPRLCRQPPTPACIAAPLVGVDRRDVKAESVMPVICAAFAEDHA
jgi:hypothetical protein